ncbi:MAG TPA: hypothetical protein VE197_06930 [Mycobacterium sp.]|nr:hypothetical protein [Mycobacterium sp.]
MPSRRADEVALQVFTRCGDRRVTLGDVEALLAEQGVDANATTVYQIVAAWQGGISATRRRAAR